MKNKIILAIALIAIVAICAFAAVSCDVEEQEQGEPTYKVSFDSAGGNETFDDQTYREGEILSRIAVPTRSGYVFSCWKDADGNIYNTSSVMPAHDVALTAVWIESDVTYTVLSNGISINGYGGGEDLTIPETVEGFPVVNIGDSAFSSDPALKSVTLPDTLTSIGMNAFTYCPNLEKIDFGNGLQSIGAYAFEGCTSLKELDLPASLKNIDMGAFKDCTIEKVNISDVGAWCGINFYSSDVNPASVAGGLYLNGEPLKNVVIPDGVTSISGFAFAYTDIESLVVPDSVTEIGGCAFLDCNSLGSVSLPPLKEVGLSAFSGCSSLTSATLSEGTGKISSNAFKNCASLKKIDVPASVTDIESEAFAGCTSLAEVTLREGLKTIQYGTFKDCSALTEVTIPDSVTELGEAAFENCAALGRAVIGTGVTEISYYLFSKCASLSELTVKGDVTSIGNCAFLLCNSLAEITIPATVTSIGTDAFNMCESLTKVNISDVAAWCNISFSRMTSNPVYYAKNLYVNGEPLTELVVPDGVTEIKDYAFTHCRTLQNLTIGDGVTSIGDFAFSSCALSEVSIGKNVAKIDEFAFDGCSSLTSMTFADTEGWSYAVSESEPASNWKAMDAAALSDATNAARVFTSTHKEYYWKRG